MNYDERLKFYLGDNFYNLNFNLKDYNDFKFIKDLFLNNDKYFNIYDKQLALLLIKTNNYNKFFYFKRCDIISTNQQHILTLCKNRCENNNDSVILRCLNFDRHWFNYYNKPLDIPFHLKKNTIFWRGTTTGCSDHHSSIIWRPRNINRFDFVKKWFNKNINIDIGFSFIHRDWLKNEFEQYVKGSVSISKFLINKYLISLEGNDKDSGLNWKLNSNSLVIMPRPRVTTWLMETKLIPNYHYVLLNDDFSNLEEILIWCNNNQSKCIEIIKNANKYMEQFSDNKLEEKLEEDVINKYFEIIHKKILKSKIN